jgi:tetratricopeptide (TPR) repeat protein
VKRYSASLVLVISCLAVFSAGPIAAQVDHIVIGAGTPEDKDLQTITAEPDGKKKLAMYEDFVQKYSANPAAVAYGNWQLEQGYQAAGDSAKALEYGDKALASAPHNLDILVSQATIAQQMKNNGKVMDYVAQGGAVCSSLGKEAKPAGMSDEDFAHQVSEEKSANQNNCDFFETSGFNAITSEGDPKSRMAYIDKFSTAFPESRFQEQVSTYAMDALSRLNDRAALEAYAEKTLTTNPNSLAALLLLANSYLDDPKAGSMAKAIAYSQKAIAVAKADDPDADKSRKASAGAAHTILGWAYLKQDKSAAAIPELKAGAALLKGQDEQQYARALYGLGFAYGKLNRIDEARTVLTEAVKIAGPFQPMSQDLLAKVNAARAKGK